MIKKIPTFESCRWSFYRSRSNLIPKLPQSQQDVNLQGPFTETSAGETFLRCDHTNDQNLRILIFATDDNLHRLCDLSVIFAQYFLFVSRAILSVIFTSRECKWNCFSLSLCFALIQKRKSLFKIYQVRNFPKGLTTIKQTFGVCSVLFLNLHPIWRVTVKYKLTYALK